MMVVSSARSLIVFLLVAVAASTACSADPVEPKVQENAATLAKENLLREIPAMGKAVDACDAKRKVIDIPHHDKVGVSRRDLLLGLDYFYRRNQNRCLSVAAQRYSLAKWVYEKSLAAGDTTREGVEGLELMDSLMEEWWKELQAQARYQEEVSEDARAKIENIPGLDQPFDMINSWEASGN